MDIFNRQYVLASASPRRKELMLKAGFNFTIHPANIDETPDPEISVDDLAEVLSQKKASAVANSFPDATVIAADTVVVQNNRILGKPEDLHQAKDFLAALSSHTHKVITGVSLINPEKCCSFSEVTKVEVYPLSDSEIDYYLNNYEVTDKAGAYAIQDWFGLTRIRRIEGCFYNVVGLPLPRLFEMLKQF